MNNQREIKELTGLPHDTYGTYPLTGDMGGNTIQAIAQGDDYNQRVGRIIHPYSLTIDFFLRGPQSNAGLAGTFNLPVNPVPWRIIVFQDMGYNGTVRPLSDILEASNIVNVGFMDNYISGYNDDFVRTGKHNNTNPIKILFDKRGWFVGTNSGYSDHIGQWVKCRVPGSKLSPINFNGAAVANNRAGSIFYYVLLGQDAAANNGSYLVRQTLKYTDD